MTRQEEILKGLNESWGQNGINISSNTANSSNGITVNNPTGSGRAVELNFVDGINPTRLTAAQIALLPNPQAGQIVYQTDGVVGLYTYDGTSWVTVKGSTTVFGTTNRISVTGGDTIDIASTYVGQTSITTLGTVTTGTWGAVIGQATMTLGSDATGDIYYRNSGGKLTRLGIGSAGQVLGVSAGIPAWQAAGGGITVGTTTITSGTSGRVAFNNSGVYGESANLFWDNTNNNLFVASAQGNPGTSGSSLSGVGLRIGNTSGGITGSILDFGQNGTNGSWLQARLGSNYATNQNLMLNPNGGFLLVNTTTQTNLSSANGLTQGLYLKNGSSGIGTLTYGVGGMLIETSYNSNLYPAFLISTAGANNAFCVSSAGRVQLGGVNPSAWLHLPAGTAAAGSAPLKLTSGTNLTTPENGAFEFDGTNLYFTVGGVRKTVTLL